MGDVYRRLINKKVSIEFLHRMFIEKTGSDISNRAFRRRLKGEVIGSQDEQKKINNFLRDEGYLKLIEK